MSRSFLLQSPLPAVTLGVLASMALFCNSADAKPKAAPATPTPVVKVYSPAQDKAALDALGDALQTLDHLEQRLLPSYGSAVPIIRMERVKRGPVLTEGPSLAGTDLVEKPLHEKPGSVADPIKEPASTLIRRIASIEPITAACGFSNETLYTLSVLSDETGALLEKRHLAKGDERLQWMRTGAQDGLQRTALVHELDCAPVRRAFEDALPAVQTAYAKVYASVEAQPELDPTPVATAPVATPAATPPANGAAAASPAPSIAVAPATK